MTNTHFHSIFMQKIPILIPFPILTLILMVTIAVPTYSQAKTGKPKWKKEIPSLQVGQTFHYRIKGCSKKTKIRFSSNHRFRASIHKKTGILHAKKKGTVIITAKVQKPNGTSVKLRTRVKIRAKKISHTSSSTSKKDSDTNPDANLSSSALNSALLDSANLKISEAIDPWNHSLILYSSRILLQSEVKDSRLTVSHISESLMPLSFSVNTVSPQYNSAILSDSTEPLTAEFSSLSKDGKQITYRLSEHSAQIMCPGDGTQDGTYQITGSLFSDSYLIHYQERLQSNRICGFVTTDEGTALPQVSVTLSSSSSDISAKSTITDQNGYYCFTDIPEEEITLTAQAAQYDRYSQTIHSDKPMTCQNIILHPDSTNNLAVFCQIKDSQMQPVTDATVLITDAQNNPVIQGKIDENGEIAFANQNSNTIQKYTVITYQNATSIPSYRCEELSVPNPFLTDSESSFARNQQYQLYVLPGTDGTSMPKDYHMVSFTFSFTPLISDQLVLQIYLKKLPLITIDKLSIHAEQLTQAFSHLKYSLYDSRGNLVYQTPLSSSSTDDYTDSLSSMMQNDSLRLYDGQYYTSITAYSSESLSTSVSATQTLPTTIHNGILESIEYSLAPASQFRILLYLKFPRDTETHLTFNLYQKSDTIWIPTGTCTSDSLTSLTSSTAKSYLELSSLLPNTTYCLVPTNDSYTITSGSIFDTPSTLYSDTLQETPDHQLILSLSSVADIIPETIQIGDSILDNIACPEEPQILDFSFYASASTYPNTIYAYYEMNGTFRTMFLATPAFLSFQDECSALSICDQLQNGKTIRTSQSSYRTTPFFVT